MRDHEALEPAPLQPTTEDHAMTNATSGTEVHDAVDIAAVGGSGPKLGRLPSKSDTQALMFHRFAVPPRVLPKATNYWRKRSAFPLRSFGNTAYGSCTRSKQAVAHMRIERLETRQTPKIDDAE